MRALKIFLCALLMAVFVKFSYSKNSKSDATCQFNRNVTNFYTCVLFNASVESIQEEIDIGGKHMPGQKDSNVNRLTADLSIMLHIPPTIFVKFSNLQRLELDNVGLVDIHTRTFFNCTNLEFLNLSKNKLTFILSGTFQRCRNLIEIDLSENNISSIQSDAFMSLMKMKTLILEMNSLGETAEPFKDLISLKTLNLRSNLFICLRDDLIDQLELNTLILSDNDLIYIPRHLFKNGYSLTRLELEHNRLTLRDASPFYGLINLRVLYLRFNSIMFIHRTVFSNLFNLRELRLGNNDIVAIDSFAFSSLPNLQILDLSFNVFASVTTNPRLPLRNLIQLTTLDLSFNSIFFLEKGFGLSENINLVNLYLNDNKIYYIYSKLFENLEKLTYLQLSNNELIVLPYEIFSKNFNLRNLFINNNFLTRLDSALFEPINQLIRFDAVNNTIDEIETNFLTAIINVSILRLSGNTCISRNFPNGTAIEVKFFSTCFENYENRNMESITMPAPTTGSPSRKNNSSSIFFKHFVNFFSIIFFINILII